MKLQQLTVGPIVGETTPNRARIWGRGDTTVVDGQPRRCFGALRYREAASNDWRDPVVIKMNPNFDMTGVAIVDGLDAETRYEYEFGYFFSDVEMSDARFRASDWTSSSRGKFLTASDDSSKARTIVLGSCRYLLRTFFGSVFDDRGDKTFRSIVRQIEDDGIDVHQLIMMGDQIYADDLNFISPDKSIDQFYERYRDAFSQDNIRKLMSIVPTYMTLDDHEIEDNWPAKASEKDWKTLFPVAMHAYQAYQLSHSPNIPIRRGRLTGPPNHLWYSYSDGCCDVFVTDSRTERLLDPKFGREMISADQIRALKRWLKDGSDRVKLVVTSVPFFPDSASGEGSDKWSGFQTQREELLQHIEENQIRKVVFCSGDVHASLSVQLTSPSGLKITSIVSSAFFWPYPHPSARSFQLRGSIDGGKAGTFRLSNASSVISDDNFTRLRVLPSRVDVEVFERKGRRRGSKRHTF